MCVWRHRVNLGVFVIQTVGFVVVFESGSLTGLEITEQARLES